MLKPTRRNWLLIILLVALAARAGFALMAQITYPDSQTDLEIARNLLDGKGFIFRDRILLRAPGYPLLLAASLGLGGWWFVLLLQVLAGAATCFIVYAMARQVFSEDESLLAAGLAAIEPTLVYMAGTLLAEAMFIFLFCASVYFLLMLRRCLDWRHAAAAGFLNGLACLLRPSHFLFLPFLLPFFLIRGGSRLKALGVWAIAAAASFLALSPWVVRNYSRTGKLVFTTLQVGASLYEANSPDATGGPAMDKIAWPEEIHSMAEYERDNYLKQAALAYMRGHPRRTLELALVKLRRFWNPVPNDPQQRTPLVSGLMLASYLPVMALGFVGIVSAVARRAHAGLLLVPVLYYSLLHAVFVGSVRYRVPVMPFVLVFSGCGLVVLLRSVIRFRSKGARNAA